MNHVLLVGVALSLAYSELTDLSPGGIIVPAYFAAYLYDWKRLLGTVAVAFASVGLVRLLSCWAILYGRRRYATYIIVGILLKYALGLLGLGTVFPVGVLIPGILGRDMERQGAVPTLLSLGVVTLFTVLVLAAGRSLR